MQSRTIAATVFFVGAVAFAAVVALNGSGNSASPEFVDATTAVNDGNFNDVVRASGKPVVMDFYGDYCSVCRKLEPQLTAMAKEHADTAVFARVNIAEAPGACQAV